MYSTNHGFHTYDHMLFDGENGTESFSPEYFAEHSEHVILMTIALCASLQASTLNLCTGEFVRMYWAMYDNKFDRLLDAIEDSLLLRLAICAPIAVGVMYGIAVAVSYSLTLS